MKNTILTFILFSILFSCKAQTPVIDLYGNDAYGSIENAYYKDLNNFHDQYIGTWIYSNGSTSLKLIFAKRNFIYNSDSNFYEDFLVGEYQYINNGIEKVNTLNSININYGNNALDVINHNLVGGGVTRNASMYPKCNDCLLGEQRIELYLNEPTRKYIIGLTNSFVLRVFTEGNLQKLKVWFVDESKEGMIFDDNDHPSTITNFSLPYGEYTLIKQ